MADVFNTDDMLDTYLYENRLLLDQLQEIVLAKRNDTHFDQISIHKMFRTMHTIKGSSGVMMHDGITKVSHKLEDVLALVREMQPEDVPHMELVEYVLAVSDFISAELVKVEKGESLDTEVTELMETLDAFLELIKSKTEGQRRETYVQETSAQQFYIAPAASEEKKDTDETIEPFFFIDLESSVEEIEARVERTQQQIMEESKTMQLAPGDFVIQTKETAWGRSTEKSKYIRVDIDKMNQLVNIVDSLIVSQSEVIHNPDLQMEGLVLDDFHQAAEKMLELSGSLQDMIFSIRCIPLINIFQRMNRIVFDVSRKLGKDIELVMEGEDTEVDKSIAEQIADPLMHLIRNAVDHGIELPQERRAVGKPARGRIVLSARKDSDYLWIVVEDNGRGLDKTAIYDKACRLGLVEDQKTLEELSDKEVFQWLTFPGFSTKEEVSEYSGRGVGLDVVVSNIIPLGGCLEIESETGEGSRMILKIPLRQISHDILE